MPDVTDGLEVVVACSSHNPSPPPCPHLSQPSPLAADVLYGRPHSWTVNVVNWWRSRSPVYHTDRRHLCRPTTRWARGTASGGTASGSGDKYSIFGGDLFKCISDGKIVQIIRRLFQAAGAWTGVAETAFAKFSSCPSQDIP